MRNPIVVFSFFCFRLEKPFLGEFGPKNQNCQFKLKLGTYNHLRNFWDELQFSCEIAHYGKSLIFIFQKFFASIIKIFILARKLGTGLSFYRV